MKEELTLSQAWEYCLEMWKWIAEEWAKGRRDVYMLKDEWLSNHPRFGLIHSNCFFCQYALQRMPLDELPFCKCCPGHLVSKKFFCDNKSYNYETKPIQFYQKLLKLNEKRKNGKDRVTKIKRKS